MPKRIFLLLCSGLLAVLPSLSLAGEATRGFGLDARVALNAYRALVETQLECVLDELEVLASTEEAASGNWERLKPPLTLLRDRVGTSAAVWFAQPDGTYFTVDQGAAGQSLADRPYFAGLMAGQPVKGELVVSKSTGKRSIIIAAPVSRDGKLIGALGVSIDTEKLAHLLDERMRLPNNVVFYAIDAQGRTALHRDTAFMFQFPSEMGSASLRHAVKEMLAQPQGVVRYSFKGAQKTAVFEKSEATGWVFVLGAALPARHGAGG